MSSSGSSGSGYVGELESTERASGHTMRRASPFAANRNVSSDRPLLDELNTTGSNQIKLKEKETLPKKTAAPRTESTCNVRAKANNGRAMGRHDRRSLEERCSDHLDAAGYYDDDDTLEQMCSDHLDAAGYYDDDDTLEQMCSDFRDGISVAQSQEDSYSNELYGDDLYADYFDD